MQCVYNSTHSMLKNARCIVISFRLNTILIIIIIMAGMAVVLRGWLPHRGEAQMAYNYCFPTRTMF